MTLEDVLNEIRRAEHAKHVASDKEQVMRAKLYEMVKDRSPLRVRTFKSSIEGETSRFVSVLLTLGTYGFVKIEEVAEEIDADKINEAPQLEEKNVAEAVAMHTAEALEMVENGRTHAPSMGVEQAEAPEPVDDGGCDPLYGKRMDSADLGQRPHPDDERPGTGPT